MLEARTLRVTALPWERPCLLTYLPPSGLELCCPWSLPSAAVGRHPPAAQSGGGRLPSVECLVAFFVGPVEQTTKHADPDAVTPDAGQDTY